MSPADPPTGEGVPPPVALDSGEKSPPGAVVVAAEGIAKSFDGREVLGDVSFTVKKGQTVVVMGRSGSGKTTCLRVLMGQERPDRGRVLLFGKDIFRLPRAAMDRIRRRFGVVFQSGALLNSMNVLENVALPLRELTELDEKVIGIMVKLKLEQVGLRGFEELMPSQLSGGMKKRVGIARALALDPEIMFYDEPTAGLDPVMSAVISQLIREIGQTLGVASVVVSHDMENSLGVADRLIMLYMGRVVIDGTPEEIRKSEDPLVRQFVDGEAEGPIPLRMANVDLVEDLLGE
jgi:phospholipid/cholesterol/gamma-HCH transport system ATP-binding protein